MVEAKKEAESSTGSKGGRRKNVVIALLVVLLVASLGGLAYLGWTALHPNTEGTTISNYDGMSREEIQAELDRQAMESRMTISVNSQPTLQDGKVRVNVMNDSSNKFWQSFTLEQDGQTLYESGAIEPGNAVEWVDASNAHAGTAMLTISALDADSKQPHGNPQSVEVNIVQG